MFKIGDRVKISPESEFYKQAPDEIGVVALPTDAKGWTRVRFQSRFGMNAYNRLILVKRAPIRKKIVISGITIPAKIELQPEWKMDKTWDAEKKNNVSDKIRILVGDLKSYEDGVITKGKGVTKFYEDNSIPLDMTGLKEWGEVESIIHRLEDLKYLFSDIETYSKRILEIRSLLEVELQKSVPKIDVALDIKRLKKHSRIQKTIIANTYIEFETKPLVIEDDENGAKYEIGRYNIHIERQFRSIRIKNLTYKIGAEARYDHPHILNGGVCWGYWEEQVRKYFDGGQLYFFIDTVIRFLERRIYAD